MPKNPYAFTPPAASGLPVTALDSATRGANMIDAYALTPNGRNLLAHALVQLARDGWLRTEADPGAAFEPCDKRSKSAVELDPNCSAGLMSLGPEPDERCIVRGRHETHRAASGLTWTDADSGVA
jgi:hypothetical protein